jgi:hypothetical protein
LRLLPEQYGQQQQGKQQGKQQEKSLGRHPKRPLG